MKCVSWIDQRGNCQKEARILKILRGIIIIVKEFIASVMPLKQIYQGSLMASCMLLKQRSVNDFEALFMLWIRYTTKSWLLF